MDLFSLDGQKIALGIAAKMKAISSSNFSLDSLNPLERKWVDRITMMIRNAESGEIRVQERTKMMKEDEEVEDSDLDWDFESGDEDDDSMTGKPTKPTREMFDKALEYYREGGQKTNRKGEGTRTFDSMQNRFRWIRTKKIMDSIVRYGTTGEFQVSRNEVLHQLAEDLDQEVSAIMAEGHEIHDKDIQFLAKALNDQSDNPVANFKASDSWIDRWKRKYNVVSRHITVLVSVKTKKDMEKTKEKVKELQEEIAEIVRNNPGISIRNADQTGLVKELHGKRTLARKGVKKVEALCQSKSATTHSITLLPVIGSDGYQNPKLFVQLGERGGVLPPTVNVFTHPTLYTAVHSSHIMTRDTALEFYKNVLFYGPLPPKLLLILDSWPAFKDHNTIRSCCPAGTELIIKNIPPGATSLCQPADLSYNHAVKGIQRRLTTMIIIRQLDYQISQRDNLLKFALQVHWILGADRFKPFIMYGFYKGGFVPNHPPAFPSPKEYIFGKGSDNPCPCNDEGCTLCPKCEKAFCFSCFWQKLHRC